jgi:hypothetical protein
VESVTVRCLPPTANPLAAFISPHPLGWCGAKITEIRPELTLLRSWGDAALRRASPAECWVRLTPGSSWSTGERVSPRHLIDRHFMDRHFMDRQWG